MRYTRGMPRVSALPYSLYPLVQICTSYSSSLNDVEAFKALTLYCTSSSPCSLFHSLQNFSGIVQTYFKMLLLSCINWVHVKSLCLYVNWGYIAWRVSCVHPCMCMGSEVWLLFLWCMCSGDASTNTQLEYIRGQFMLEWNWCNLSLDLAVCLHVRSDV